jgi:tight adherence protein C
MYLFLAMGIVCLGVAVAALLFAFGARRMRTAQRLSTIHEYGFTAEAVMPTILSSEPKRSIFTGGATWLGDVLSRRLGSVNEDEMREQLMAAGMYTSSPRTMLGYRVLAAIILPILVFVVTGGSQILDIFAMVLMLFAGWTFPLTYVQRKARKRLAEIDRRLPDLIDLLTVMVEAGLSFSSALRLGAPEFEPPLSDELRLTLQEQTMGLGIDEALSNMAQRADTPAMRSFVRAMAQGERMGISTGQIMRSLSIEMRARRKALAEEKAQKAPILMLFPLVFLVFPAMFIVLMTPAIINLVHSFKGV